MSTAALPLLLQHEEWEELSWQLSPSLPLFPLDALFCLFSFFLNPQFHLLFPSPLFFVMKKSFSPSLFHPLLSSSAGWLIVAPQLCGWHMHQSLTNTTWSPETHSSTKNASVFFPLCCSHSVFVIFPRPPCSQTRVHFLPVCRTVACGNVNYVPALLNLFYQAKKSSHPGCYGCFINGDYCVNSFHQMSRRFAQNCVLSEKLQQTSGGLLGEVSNATFSNCPMLLFPIVWKDLSVFTQFWNIYFS